MSARAAVLWAAPDRRTRATGMVGPGPGSGNGVGPGSGNGVGPGSGNGVGPGGGMGGGPGSSVAANGVGVSMTQLNFVGSLTTRTSVLISRPGRPRLRIIVSANQNEQPASCGALGHVPMRSPPGGRVTAGLAGECCRQGRCRGTVEGWKGWRLLEARHRLLRLQHSSARSRAGRGSTPRIKVRCHRPRSRRRCGQRR